MQSITEVQKYDDVRQSCIRGNTKKDVMAFRVLHIILCVHTLVHIRAEIQTELTHMHVHKTYI